MQHWKPTISEEARGETSSPMMKREHRPFWAALRRRLLSSDDAIGWSAVAIAALLLSWMAVGILIAWIGGRI